MRIWPGGAIEGGKREQPSFLRAGPGENIEHVPGEFFFSRETARE